MDKKEQSEADNKSVIPKGAAMSCCEWPMRRIMDLMQCPYDLEVPEGLTAEEVAEKVGGKLVRTFDKEVVKFGKRVVVKIAVVRVATGLLVASSALSGLPEKLIQVEQVAEDLGIAKITVNAAKALPEHVDYGDLAKAVSKDQAPIIGDSAEILAKSAVRNLASHVFWAFDAIQLVMSARDAIDAKDRERDEKRDRACCDIVREAVAEAWKLAPKTFHEASYKTDDARKRYYGQRRTRTA